MVKKNRRFKFDEIRQRFRLTPTERRVGLFVAAAFVLGLITKCYRDEDLRADRQPEFTQIDIEMSFIDREDIYMLIEGLLKRIWKTALNIDLPTPFKRICFKEALDRYGIDKPDSRFGMELADFTEEFRSSTFKVFSGAVSHGGVVKASARDEAAAAFGPPRRQSRRPG